MTDDLVLRLVIGKVTGRRSMRSLTQIVWCVQLSELLAASLLGYFVLILLMYLYVDAVPSVSAIQDMLR